MKKTYSKLNGELTLSHRENTRTDPFDELLSSPIKQNIQFQPLSFWGRKEKKLGSKTQPRKVKCELFESSESDETISPCGSSGFSKKEKANANYFDEVFSKCLESHTQIEPLTFYEQKEIESVPNSICDFIGSSDSDELTSPCEFSGLESSFLTGLQNVTKRRGISYDSHKNNSEKISNSFNETNEKIKQDSPDIDHTTEPSQTFERLSLRNVTKRRGYLFKATPKEFKNSMQEDEEVELSSLFQTDETLKLSQINEKISSTNLTKKGVLSSQQHKKNSEKYNDSSEESDDFKMETVLEIDKNFELPHITKRITSKSFTKQKDPLNDSNSNDYDKYKISLKSKEKINLNSKFEIDQTLELSEMTERLSLDSNKSIVFAHPILESTRVQDVSSVGKNVPQKPINQSSSILQESRLNFGYALKPGKNWLRSMSVLKQIQNENIAEEKFESTTLSNKKLESTRITGRKFKSFVKDVLEMQNGTLCEYPMDYYFDESDVSQLFRNNCSIISKTVLNKSTLEKSLLNYTVKVVQREDRPSALKSALGLEDCTLIQDGSLRNQSFTTSARDFILIQCCQTDVLPFEEYFNKRTLKNCKKIGEGVYGEVFKTDDAVIKIIPIEGLDKVNGEPQKTFEEIISEVVIASKLSSLRKGEKNRTCGFSEMRRCWCVEGKYPKYLLELWDEYDQMGSGSENDSPVMFKSDQLYIVLELENGGKDLESFVFNSSAQSLSIFIQVAFSLAVAEKAFEFEHRDLHWGNILISPTKDDFMIVVLNDVEYKIPTKGVKVCIIDFTLSRISHEGCCIFNDLSVDPGLFTSEGDYQFEIYRLMLREVQNDWSLFKPKTNIYWLHYMLDKMIKMVRYKNKKAKLHVKFQKDLQTLESVVLKHLDCENLVLSDTLNNIIKKL